MSDTFHIKRFEEHGRYYDQDGFEYVVEQAHNDLAHHLELEHAARVESDEKLNAVIAIIRNATFPPELFEQVKEAFKHLAFPSGQKLPKDR